MITSPPPTLEFVHPFTVIGFHVRTQNSEEFSEKSAKIPAVWQQFSTSALAVHPKIFGVYSEYASDANDFYTYTVGVLDEGQAGEFHKITVNSGQYLVFKGHGPMPLTVIETWKRIWAYFAEETAYQRTYTSDFEAYNGPTELSVYIGIL